MSFKEHQNYFKRFSKHDLQRLVAEFQAFNNGIPLTDRLLEAFKYYIIIDDIYTKSLMELDLYKAYIESLLDKEEGD